MRNRNAMFTIQIGVDTFQGGQFVLSLMHIEAIFCSFLFRLVDHD